MTDLTRREILKRGSIASGALVTGLTGTAMAGPPNGNRRGGRGRRATLYVLDCSVQEGHVFEILSEGGTGNEDELCGHPGRPNANAVNCYQAKRCDTQPDWTDPEKTICVTGELDVGSHWLVTESATCEADAGDTNSQGTNDACAVRIKEVDGCP